MKYLALIYSDENDTAVNPPPESPEMQSIMEAYFAFGAAAEQAGVLLGGDALLPTSTATSVQVRDGEAITTDGPFAEAAEQIGGYYLIDAPDLDTVIELCRILPAYDIEIRPVLDTP